jgi:hypothetical protein
MDCQHTLIRIYLFVCRRYRSRLKAATQRQSNNSDPDFTDEEVLTIYLFGIVKHCKTITEVHEYTRDHFAAWFPDLPSYGGYNQRLNRLCDVFAPLLEEALSEIEGYEQGAAAADPTRVVDSMPIMMASEKRSSDASVAPELADKGYCSSKGEFYYGVKLHAVAERRRGRLPIPGQVGLTSGSKHDLTALREVLPWIEGNGQLFGDKAYCSSDLEERLSREKNIDVYTPVKKKKDQERLSAADALFSTAVSRVRQSIESLFNWIDEKTGIQTASNVRSRCGLMVHVFGRLTAAMLLLAFNP